MTLDALLALAVGDVEATTGLNPTVHLLSPATRRGLADALVGRTTVALGAAVGGYFNVGAAAQDLLRRRALADALRHLAGVCALYGVTAAELADALGHQEPDGG